MGGVTEAPPAIPGLVHERLLGSGGYSQVYLYRQLLPMRQVAVKVLKDSGLNDSVRDQLTAEANTMAGLADHPYIVPVISAAITEDGRPYIVMTFYSRPNLAVRAASERLGVAEVLRIGIQIASAVETAHRAGILHRDIKPANLLINSYGAPGLSDFGIAGTIMDEDDSEMGVSVPWSPPEVLYSTAPTSVRSDVYSLAATLWHLLVGRSPFEVRGGDNSAFELMRRIRDVPAPSTGRPDVPDSLDRLLRQAMAKDPAVRIGSAIDFARGLQAIELELQLPRTEIVVLGDRLEPDTAPPPPSAGATTGSRTTPGNAPFTPAGNPDRPVGPFDPGSQPPIPASPAHVSDRRPPVVSGPVPDGPGPLPPPLFEPVAPTVARPANYRSQPTPPSFGPSTADRPGTAAGAGPGAPRPGEPPADDHARSGSRRGLAIAVAASVAVVGLVVGGVVLFGGSQGTPAPAPTVGSSADGTQDAGLPGEDLPPGPVSVTGRRTGDRVVFSWTYSAALPSDSFQVRTVSDGQVHAASRPTYTVTTRSRSQVCVQVRVIRADGSNASPDFSSKGCA